MYMNYEMFDKCCSTDVVWHVYREEEMESCAGAGKFICGHAGYVA